MVLNFLRSETNHILFTTDAEVAKRLNLEAFKYYSYYKPSYLNGYENLADKDINIHHLQAFESLCRDEFIPKTEYMQSDGFLSDLSKNEGLFTKPLIEKHFDDAFDRTYDVSFLANPSFKERFKSKDAHLPQCFIYVPDDYFKKYVFEIKDVIKNYQNMIEFVFTNNHDEARECFYVDEYPDVMPFFAVIDKTKKIPV
jgi:hypothetical protein